MFPDGNRIRIVHPLQAHCPFLDCVEFPAAAIAAVKDLDDDREEIESARVILQAATLLCSYG